MKNSALIGEKLSNPFAFTVITTTLLQFVTHWLDAKKSPNYWDMNGLNFFHKMSKHIEPSRDIECNQTFEH